MIKKEMVESMVRRCDICGKVIQYDSNAAESVILRIPGFSDWTFKFQGDCCNECMSKIRIHLARYIDSLIPSEDSHMSSVYDNVNADKILALKEILENDKIRYN